MDAVKFLAERQRMCDTYYNSESEKCSAECPATGIQCVDMRFIHENAHEEEIVARVEKWSATHPIKTRQSVFLEQYPNARIDSHNTLYICPADIYGDAVCPANRKNPCILCCDCRREFWVQEME